MLPFQYVLFNRIWSYCSILVSFLLFETNTMPITSNGGVLLPALLAATLARFPAHDHIFLFRDAMSFMLREIDLALSRVRTRRRPRQVVPPDLDVIVSEFSELVIVHAQEFSFFRRSQVESWDVVDAIRQDEAYGKGPPSRGKDVSELDVKIAVIVVDPAAGNDACVDTVQSNNVGCAEQRISH